MYSNNTSSDNTAHGYEALRVNVIGIRNTAIGSMTLRENTGNDNTATGYAALQNTVGNQNTATGGYVLRANTSGIGNTAIGYASSIQSTTGNRNTALGSFSLNINTTGNNNTAIGYDAGPNVDGLSNTTCIGNGARVNNANNIRIGNTAVTAVEGQVAYTIASDKRFKFNIQEDVKGLDFILKLRPVTYQFDSKLMDQFSNGRQIAFASYDATTEKSFKDAAAIRRTGLIAQEVEKAANETHYDFDGINKPKSDKDYYTLSYATLVVPLIKAVQEQQQTIEQLKKGDQNDETLKKENERLNKEIEFLKQKEKSMAARLEQIEAMLKK